MKTPALAALYLVAASCSQDAATLANNTFRGSTNLDAGAPDAGGAGGLGVGGAGGSAGAAVTALTLPENPRIMPLGDSITYGTGDLTGGYRQDLWLAHPTIVPIGTQSTPLPLAPGKDRHEGHSGFSLPSLAAGFPAWLADAGPADAVLLHGGTNDITDSTVAADAVESVYQALMAANPRAILFVATPIIRIQDAPADWVAEQFAQDAAIQSRLPSLLRAIAVAMPALAPTEMWDNWHPNADGYHKMAIAWEAALRAAGVP
jgi:lysophospholipase L1-like esterase